MVYGYARCSTNEDKQDIDRQRRELKKLGVNDNEIFFEYGSGSNTERVQLERLLSTVKQGDTIVTTEVSRLTRSTKQLCEIIELAKDRKLELIIGTFKVDCRQGLDPMTDGMLKMMGVFAEMEQNIISQRVKSGMENAKAKGVKIGRPTTTYDDLPELFVKYVHLHTSKQISKTALARLCNLSRPSVAKYLKIYDATQKEALKLEIAYDEAKDRKLWKKEEKKQGVHRYMTDDELERIAEDEETTVSNEGISVQWTPATYEIRRRERKQQKNLAKRHEEECSFEKSMNEVAFGNVDLCGLSPTNVDFSKHGSNDVDLSDFDR